ncbi:MAG: hypothetical protein IJJ00_02520 [Erysipelotrichaceae bacterium]|nr:hypothetical protein [Erysipelotrichaceae bacterium]
MKTEIIDIIENLNENYFDELKEFSNEVITFDYLTKDDVTKKNYIEKVCSYIEAFCIKNTVKEVDLYDVFAERLQMAASFKLIKGSREEKYFNKLKTTVKEIKKAKAANIDLLKNVSRIFVSLYHYCLIDKKTFSFDLSMDYLKSTISRLKESKTYKDLHKSNRKTDYDIKYNKILFVDFLLVLLYLDMLMNAPQSEVED